MTDLFMERVEAKGNWTLMCPNECPGLCDTWGQEFKTLYGVKEGKFKSVVLNFNLKFLKFTRPFLPPFFRLIAPARWANQRIKKKPSLKFKDKANF